MPHRAVEIRKAGPQDAEAINEVQVRTWQTAYVDYFTKEFLDGQDRFLTASGIEQRRGFLSNEAQTTLVAEDEGLILGFASVLANREELGEDVGELAAIYVDPDHWGRGIGSALLKSAEATLVASGFKRAILWTLSANQRTRRFYERHGWRFDGARSTFVTGAELIRYARELP
jgi:GNAT superfamily N-acetyltransferase